MTQEQKNLLLRDLCARLPYGVKVQVDLQSDTYSPIVCKVCSIEYAEIGSAFIGVETSSDTYNEFREFLCKSYLFPLSSMTEEQKYDFYCRFIENDCDFDDFKEFYLDYGMWHKLLTTLDDIEAIIDWFNKNHFDYRGLIPMGLAEDATGLNIY